MTPDWSMDGISEVLMNVISTEMRQAEIHKFSAQRENRIVYQTPIYSLVIAQTGRERL